MSASSIRGGIHGDPGVADPDVDVVREATGVWLRFGDRLVVGGAAATRRLLVDELDAVPADGRAIVDLGAITELDAAGLAAVTAPVFAALRRGVDVAVLPPATGPARRFADTVGILPIGVG